MLFYTGKGDLGQSHIGKKKYPKDSPILEVLGELDELNSLCGLARSLIRDEILSRSLRNVQESLFIIQAQIAWLLFSPYGRSPVGGQSPKLKKEKIRNLEQEIKVMEKKINPERGFVIPGSNKKAAWLDYLRAVSRRAERKVFSLSRLNGGQAKKYKVPPEILIYLNRLSSYLYALARLELHKKRIKEPKPTYK